MQEAQGYGRLPKDYLIPFPSSNGHGCRRRELSYDTASAMQNRVLRMVKSSDEFLFCSSATRFWTPQSNRTFMRNARATLGFEKVSQLARIAAQRIWNMQRTVVAELQKDLVDPLAEAETSTDSSPSKVCRRRNVVDV